MATECFKATSFTPDRLALIEKANELLEEYGKAVTLRGLYYLFIGRDLFPESWIDRKYNKSKGLDPETKNTIKSYKRLVALVGDARLAGLIDWSLLQDDLREAVVWAEYGSIREPIEDAARGFRLERWADQENYVELWVEKNTLAAIAEPIASEFHVPLMVNRGYSSLSAMYRCAQRLMERSNQPESKYFDDERPVRQPIVIYVGDHDPSGEDMVRDVAARLETFGVRELEVRKAALTMEQVRRHRLPPNPAKASDSRADKYVEEHGDKSWEVEALSPDLIEKYIREAFEPPLFDPAKMRAVVLLEALQRKKLDAAIAKALRGLSG